ncbi:ABC transporter permease [Anaerobacillus isosaccharinicus]|uniref:ABC transporter permease n=1 Tax=Anaerobacillus isosaccharinicus TaxID=1532552 RepID=A0A1S2LHQ8_9BACI|nr:ABC transporter permease [Anaerobacillus isosaccharinicus]MBA5586609.1 ABC transporter permease [Anaerobacillus isosaccharinicus]QOY35156.1 ABC transporter permease [Anaerobacillus isosaccharinicus]
MGNPVPKTDFSNVVVKPKKKRKRFETLRLFYKNILNDRLALTGCIILFVFLIVAVFSNFIAPYDINEMHRNEQGDIKRLQPPSSEHIFGTTNVGRDIFSQVVQGAKTALLVGILAAVLVTFVGTTVGIISGYYGGWVDAVMMRIVDIFYAIPFIPFVIVLVTLLEPSIWNVILAVSLLSWRTVARIVRSQVLSVAQRPFIKAARVAGASNFRIMWKYVLPNVVPLALLEMAFMVNWAITAEASVAFLGLGDPDVPSWGQILHLAFLTGNSREAWWWMMPPGLAIVFLLVSIFFIARALESVVNPRLRSR